MREVTANNLRFSVDAVERLRLAIDAAWNIVETDDTMTPAQRERIQSQLQSASTDADRALETLEAMYGRL